MSPAQAVNTIARRLVRNSEGPAKEWYEKFKKAGWRKIHGRSAVRKQLRGVGAAHAVLQEDTSINVAIFDVTGRIIETTTRKDIQEVSAYVNELEEAIEREKKAC